MGENVLNNDENELIQAQNYVDERYYWLKTAENRQKSAKKVNKIRVLSLFSGIGSPEKALQNLGINYELVGFSEIDKYAAKSYAAVHGVDESLNLGDITKINEQTLPKDIDLMTYGFPCTDISVAGKQLGFEDENGYKTRSGLFFDALRIIQYVQPKVAIAENVKNLTGKKFKIEFATILNSLDEAGYNCYWKVLNARDFGVPQNRERVFIVSIRKDIDNGLFQFPDTVPLDLLLKDVLEDEVDEKYYANDEMIEILSSNIDYNKKDKYCFVQDVCYCIDANYAKSVSFEYFLKKRIRQLIIENKESSVQIGNCMPTKNRKNPSQGRVYSINGLSPTLTTMSGGGRMPFIVESAATHDVRIRRLTSKETWRLMGFTDEDFEKAEKVNSNSQLYKQAGNSIVVQVMEAIYKQLQLINKL